METKLANLLFQNDHGQDRSLADYRPEIQEMYREEARGILELIDTQRCVWTPTMQDGSFYHKTECGHIVAYYLTDAERYCPCCGKRISIGEVQDGQG